MRQLSRVNLYTNRFFRKDHYHFFALRPQRGCNLRANKAAANHQKLFPGFAQMSQVLVILKVPIIDDIVTPKR